MKLLYKAATNEGKIVRGLIDARDVSEAGLILRKQGLLPILVKAKTEQGIIRFLPFFKRSTATDLIFFTRQLASMLDSGLTLMQSLRILKDQLQKEVTVEIVSEIIGSIEEGKPLSESIAKHEAMFPPLYVSLVKAAEGSGLLDKVLERLAENLEKQARLKSTIRGALIYPAVIVVGMVTVIGVMMVVVIPQLSVLYESLNVKLPLPTRIVVGLSNFSVTFWPFILGLFVLLLFFFRRWRKTDTGRLVLDDLILRLPILGPIVRSSILAELARTFGLLVGSGTLIVDALRQTSEVVGNVPFRNAMLAASERVEKGITVGDALAASSLFPPILIEMVRIGEQTGKLDEQLLRVSDYFEREVDQTVKNLTTLMEPLIIVFLGGAVGFLIIAVIVPIYNLITSLQ